MPLSCFFDADSKSKSSITSPFTTTTRVSSGWLASMSILFAILSYLHCATDHSVSSKQVLAGDRLRASKRAYRQVRHCYLDEKLCCPIVRILKSQNQPERKPPEQKHLPPSGKSLAIDIRPCASHLYFRILFREIVPVKRSQTCSPWNENIKMKSSLFHSGQLLPPVSKLANLPWQIHHRRTERPILVSSAKSHLQICSYHLIPGSASNFF